MDTVDDEVELGNLPDWKDLTHDQQVEVLFRLVMTENEEPEPEEPEN